MEELRHQRLDADGGEIAITGNDPAVLNGDHGPYAILDQMIYFTGLMATRPNDMLGIAYARTEISGDLAANVSDSGETTIIPRYEAVLEVSYTAQIIPGFAIQPDFQYFWNPGGRVADADDPAEAVPDTAVLGLRTTLNY